MKKTITEIVNYVRSFPDIKPIIEVGSHEPAITVANEVMKQILETPCQCYRFPLKESAK